MAKKPWEVERHRCSVNTCFVHLPPGMEHQEVTPLMKELYDLDGVRSTANVDGEHIEVRMQDASVLDRITEAVGRFRESLRNTPALT